MSSAITILPGPFEHLTKANLRARGLALSSVQRGSRVRTDAHRPFVPVLTNVLVLRPSIVESIFRFAERPQ